MASENWVSLSEIVAGRVVKGKIALNKVRPELFVEPYDRIIELMGKGYKTTEELISMIGQPVISAALNAAEATHKQTEGGIDWEIALEQTAVKSMIASKLMTAARRLEKGEEVNSTEILEYFRDLDSQKPYILTMDKVTEDATPFIPSGWPAIDDHLGGIPKAGLITIGASPKVGKTTFMAAMAYRFKRQYPDKKVCIFTLEMNRAEFKNRMLILFPDLREDMDLQSRILIEDAGGLSVQEVANRAARESDIGLVCVDFADLMIQDENNESEMAKIYRVLANLAKTMQCPVILLSQFSKEYRGGIPLPRYLRYTSLAEALSWMVLCLYNPGKDFMRSKDTQLTLPDVTGYAYIVAWAIRGGFVVHAKDGESPGAIQVSFSGTRGWGEYAKGWNRVSLVE